MKNRTKTTQLILFLHSIPHEGNNYRTRYVYHVYNLYSKQKVIMCYILQQARQCYVLIAEFEIR